MTCNKSGRYKGYTLISRKEKGAEAPSIPAEAGGQQLWHGSGRGRMDAGYRCPCLNAID